jgi:hypothetical protein
MANRPEREFIAELSADMCALDALLNVLFLTADDEQVTIENAIAGVQLAFKAAWQKMTDRERSLPAEGELPSIEAAQAAQAVDVVETIALAVTQTPFNSTGALLMRGHAGRLQAASATLRRFVEGR